MNYRKQPVWYPPMCRLELVLEQMLWPRTWKRHRSTWAKTKAGYKRWQERHFKLMERAMQLGEAETISDYNYGFRSGFEAFNNGSPKLFPGASDASAELYEGWHAGWQSAWEERQRSTSL